MRKLNAFTFTTLNGYFEGPGRDISWHRHGAEENEYAAEGLASGSTLVFGRLTYQLMAGYWPTRMALENDPTVAKGMNEAEKIVFSRTLKKADWNNTRIVSGDIVAEVKRMKESAVNDLTILGSGSIVSQCAEHGLIDEFQIMIDPVALGKGTSLFGTLSRKLDFILTGTKTFKSGVVLLSYRPVLNS